MTERGDLSQAHVERFYCVPLSGRNAGQQETHEFHGFSQGKHVSGECWCDPIVEPGPLGPIFRHRDRDFVETFEVEEDIWDW